MKNNIFLTSHATAHVISAGTKAMLSKFASGTGTKGFIDDVMMTAAAAGRRAPLTDADMRKLTQALRRVTSDEDSCVSSLEEVITASGLAPNTIRVRIWRTKDRIKKEKQGLLGRNRPATQAERDLLTAYESAEISRRQFFKNPDFKPVVRALDDNQESGLSLKSICENLDVDPMRIQMWAHRLEKDHFDSLNKHEKEFLRLYRLVAMNSHAQIPRQKILRALKKFRNIESVAKHLGVDVSYLRRNVYLAFKRRNPESLNSIEKEILKRLGEHFR